jgi:hypothetical protein
MTDKEALDEAKRHIEVLTTFFMDNVLWVRAAEDARAFIKGLSTAERERQDYTGVTG